MAEENERRNFLKVTVAAAAAAATSTLDSGTAEAQPVNPNAKAVLPNGSELSRGQVLQRLGLDPGTPPDAWLAITKCGSNASALKPGELQSLVKSGKLKQNTLDPVSLQKLRSAGPLRSGPKQ